MISTVLKHINNYFYMHNSSGRVIADRNTFTIENGMISPITVNILVGQYIRLKNSILNDGIYRVEHIGDGCIDISITDADYPAWVQPTGLVDAYNIDDRVTHENVRYVSLINANVFIPGSDIRWWEPVSEIEHSIRNEAFQGLIFPLAIPPDFISLCHAIEKYANILESDPKQALLIAESFGGYSYNKATNSDGIPPRWQQAFRISLNSDRKMIEEKI